MFSLLKPLLDLFSPRLDDVQDRDERFLSQAVDMCDLENRIRHLDGRRRCQYDVGFYAAPNR
jgi:hypothetical protein